jgi:hypothetical protein
MGLALLSQQKMTVFVLEMQWSSHFKGLNGIRPFVVTAKEHCI